MSQSKPAVQAAKPTDAKDTGDERGKHACSAVEMPPELPNMLASNASDSAMFDQLADGIQKLSIAPSSASSLSTKISSESDANLTLGKDSAKEAQIVAGPPKLRAYQASILKELRTLFESKNKDDWEPSSVCIYLPTGGGKTRIASELALWLQKQGLSSMFVVNRSQLIDQTERAFTAVGIPESSIEYIKSGKPSLAPAKSGHALPRVAIASIQTIRSRYGDALSRWVPSIVTSSKAAEAAASSAATPGPKPLLAAPTVPGAERAADPGQSKQVSHSRPVEKPLPHMDCIIVDEAHGAVAKTFQQLIGLYRGKGAVIVGLTATPTRLREDEDLSLVFDRLILGPNVAKLVETGVLVQPIVAQCQSNRVREELARVRHMVKKPKAVLRAGNKAVHSGNEEFDRKELAKLLSQSGIVRHSVRQWQRYGRGRRTIVFATDVGHSKALVQCMKDEQIAAEHIDGTTPQTERDRILGGLRTGSIRVVCSVGVLSEGFDEPRVDCVMLARPTLSKALYVQQVGRGLR